MTRHYTTIFKTCRAPPRNTTFPEASPSRKLQQGKLASLGANDLYTDIPRHTAAVHTYHTHLGHDNARKKNKPYWPSEQTSHPQQCVRLNVSIAVSLHEHNALVGIVATARQEKGTQERGMDVETPSDIHGRLFERFGGGNELKAASAREASVEHAKYYISTAVLQL